MSSEELMNLNNQRVQVLLEEWPALAVTLAGILIIVVEIVIPTLR